MGQHHRSVYYRVVWLQLACSKLFAFTDRLQMEQAHDLEVDQSGRCCASCAVVHDHAGTGAAGAPKWTCRRSSAMLTCAGADCSVKEDM